MRDFGKFTFTTSKTDRDWFVVYHKGLSFVGNTTRRPVKERKRMEGEEDAEGGEKAGEHGSASVCRMRFWICAICTVFGAFVFV